MNLFYSVEKGVSDLGVKRLAPRGLNAESGLRREAQSGNDGVWGGVWKGDRYVNCKYGKYWGQLAWRRGY